MVQVDDGAAALMEFTNALFKARDAGLAGTPAWDEATDVLLRLLAPVAPHIAEELWAQVCLRHACNGGELVTLRNVRGGFPLHMVEAPVTLQ